MARRLLGQRLVRVLDDGSRLAGIIVEVEAYCGVEDRGSHAFGGRRTPRNESMYARPGTAYIYFTYGMHHCLNVVCGTEGEPLAVLLRALQPVEGLEAMRRLRNAWWRSGRALTEADLCSGPGKICQSLALARAQDGLDLTTDSRLFIERVRSKPMEEELIVAGPRIGLGIAGAWADAPLRWFVRGNPHVSAGGRSGGADGPRPPDRR